MMAASIYMPEKKKSNCNGKLSWLFFLLPVLFSVALAGCLAEEDRDNLDGGETVSNINGGPTTQLFPSDVSNLFVASCTACHGASLQQAGLSLEEDKYDAVVDQASSQDGSFDLIDSGGSTADSYLYLKITGAASVGSTMPTTGTLTTIEIDVIGNWITGGAPPR